MTRLWREGGQWRIRAGHSTYWGPLAGALTYAQGARRFRRRRS
jgi:hypothetical protein